MRRLPIYFLVDVSDSMVGYPVAQVQDGMRTIIQSLRTDPYALETAYVSIIVFAGKAKVLSPMTELFRFYPPEFPVGSGTSLGKGLECLMDDIDRNVRKTTPKEKGDWKPVVFLFTDGNPTDDFSAALRKWNGNYRRHCSLVAVSIGDNADVSLLGRITEDVLVLKDTTPESFKSFFKWVTASIMTTSVSVCESGADGIKLAPADGINLEKVSPSNRTARVDENFVVLHGRCQNTGGDYLIKYSQRSRPVRELEMFRATDFKLEGAYPVCRESYEELSGEGGGRINTMELVGVPACPCCGNQIGAVVCGCGNIFCVGDAERNRCPWCGMDVVLAPGSGDGIEIDRGLG